MKVATYATSRDFLVQQQTLTCSRPIPGSIWYLQTCDCSHSLLLEQNCTLLL